MDFANGRKVEGMFTKVAVDIAGNVNRLSVMPPNDFLAAVGAMDAVQCFMLGELLKKFGAPSSARASREPILLPPLLSAVASDGTEGQQQRRRVVSITDDGFIRQTLPAEGMITMHYNVGPPGFVLGTRKKKRELMAKHGL